MEFDIRLATLENINEVMRLVVDAKVYMNTTGNYQWDENYPLQQHFENDILKGDLWLFKSSNTLAGFICINRVQPVEYSSPEWQTPEDSLVVHRMVIARQFAGRGIGQKMMQFAEELALKAGVNSIRSDTNSKNSVMLHIFNKLGYRFTGNIVLRNKPDLFCCYEKSLKRL
jgi:GNAT superfamily N-acetyltransferase